MVPVETIPGSFLRPAPLVRMLRTPLPAALRSGCEAAVAIGLVATLARTARRFLVTSDVTSTSTVVADWLINYEGGFIRRGLFGTGALWIAEALGCSPRVPLFAFVGACYVTVFAAAWLVFRRIARPTVLDAILLLSPIALMFPAVHGIAGQRKEVVLLALLGFVCLGRRAAIDTPRRAATWAAIYALLTAGCDIVPFFLPLILRFHASRSGRIPMSGAPLLAVVVPAVSMLAVQMAMTPRADLQTMCAAIDRIEPGDWYQARIGDHHPNAISWLQDNALDGVRGVVHRYRSGWHALKELVIGGIGLLPLWMARRRQAGAASARRADPLAAILLHPLTCLLGFAVLCLVASDWNRWIYIAASIITLTISCGRADRAGSDGADEAETRPPPPDRRRRQV